MQDHEKMLLSDAIETAIIAERKNIIYKRVIGILAAIDIVTIITFIIEGFIYG